MRQGEIKKKRGCLFYVLMFFIAPSILSIVAIPFFSVYQTGKYFAQGRIGDGFMSLIFTVILFSVIYGIYILVRKYILKKDTNTNFTFTKSKSVKNDNNPNAVTLYTKTKPIILNNPFRGVFVVGAAGSGKSESITVPLLQQFIDKGFSGIVYDFKFPALAEEVETFLKAKGSDLRHFYLNFNNPHLSHRVNPLNPDYLPNTSYAREYAQAIISNLMKESIQKPDFWTRSATDLLTACIWYLRVERPDICDLPHVCAMITSCDTALLKLLQSNPTTAQMTISIFNAMERGAEGQTAGVIGTLQGAISQINTPELMYVFGKDEFSLDINNPANPIILTVGSYPTLTTTFAPLCSLVITVATKMMNQPHKHKSFVLLDEAPTVFIPNIEILPNTGRSNRISTVFMCQDLAQLTDGYGREKADVIFASCNNHFYGRVGSSKTSEILSKQFGKRDVTYVGESYSHKYLNTDRSYSQSESVQERDIIKPAEFLEFGVGEFAGVTVESNATKFKEQFLPATRPPKAELPQANATGDIYGYYSQVRQDIDILLSPYIESKSTGGAIFNNTQTNSKKDEQKSVFDVFGD